MRESIIRMLQGRATAAEAESLQRWRRESPENEALVQELTRIWRGSAPSEAPSSRPRPRASDIASAAANDASATVIPLAGSHARPRPFRSRRAILAAAAVLLVLGAAAVQAVLPNNPPSFAATEIVTGAAEMVTTRLSDGTTVRLAPSSRLLVRPGPSTREVWLDGHAFFAVAHDEHRPFTVRTRAGDATVLGTRFDIRVHDQEVQVAVVEGRVALAAQGERVEASAGEVSRASEGSSPLVEAPPDLGPYLAWMDGTLLFQDTPLATAAREIEDRYGIRVLIPDSAVGRRTVSAWFTTDDAAQVLSVVCRAAGAHCTLRDSVASIEP